jgi:MFS family permease
MPLAASNAAPAPLSTQQGSAGGAPTQQGAASGAPTAVGARPPLGGRFGPMFRALRNYNYRLFWAGQFVSLTGGWIQRTAMAWLVLDLTGSPIQLGVVTMVQFLPISLFAMFGGVLADRFPKRKVLVITQIGIAVQAVVVAVLVGSGHIELWHLYVLSVIQGVFVAMDNPTRSALVVELVGRDDIGNAVALNSGNFNLSRIIGPAAGGVLIATVGMAACFWVNAVSYLPPILGLLLMRSAEFHDVPPPARGPLRQQLSEGIRYALRTPVLFGTLLLIWTLGAYGFNFITVLPLLARYVYGTGPEGYGVVSSFLGVGSLAAALVVAAHGTTSVGLLLRAAAAFSLLLAAVALIPVYAVGAVLLLILGVASIGFSATAQTLCQYAAPGQMRGRVMSLHTMLGMGMTPVGALTMGALSETLGVTMAILIASSLCGLGTFATWWYLRHRNALGSSQ